MSYVPNRPDLTGDLQATREIISRFEQYVFEGGEWDDEHECDAIGAAAELRRLLMQFMTPTSSFDPPDRPIMGVGKSWQRL